MNQIQEKNSIFFKVLFVFTIATLFFVLLSPMRVKAAESISWTALGNGVYQLDGTDIKAEVAPGTVHITGNGAILILITGNLTKDSGLPVNANL